jgi:hypothetical protein
VQLQSCLPAPRVDLFCLWCTAPAETKHYRARHVQLLLLLDCVHTSVFLSCLCCWLFVDCLWRPHGSSVLALRHTVCCCWYGGSVKVMLSMARVESLLSLPGDTPSFVRPSCDLQQCVDGRDVEGDSIYQYAASCVCHVVTGLLPTNQIDICLAR